MAVHCGMGAWQTEGSRKSKICVRMCLHQQAGCCEGHLSTLLFRKDQEHTSSRSKEASEGDESGLGTGSDTQFSSSRRLPGYGQSSLAIHLLVNHGTCIAYQDYVALQFILAQIVSILMHSKNKDMYDTNKKYILLCLLTYNVFATH